MIRNKYIDHGVHGFLLVCVLITVAVTLSVIFVLSEETWQFFQQVPLPDFLFGTQWQPIIKPQTFGVLPLLAGTVLIVVGASIVALPMGLLVATYLNEFASEKQRSVVKPILEILAGIPTVVYGYFALTFITPLLKAVYPETEIFNAASGALVVGIMILPMVASLVDDGFRAVPRALREGAYGLGATRYEVITQVVMPAAGSRIGAAVVLAVSRAVGETMAVTMAAGATPNMTINPFESIQTMTAYIVQVSLGETPAGGIEYLTA